MLECHDDHGGHNDHDRRDHNDDGPADNHDHGDDVHGRNHPLTLAVASVLDSQHLADLDRIANEHQWVPAEMVVGSGAQLPRPGFRRQMCVPYRRLEQNSALRRVADTLLFSPPARAVAGAEWDRLSAEGWQLQRTAPDGFLHWHTDLTDRSIRVMSSLTYLSTGDGPTVLSLGDRRDDIAIHPVRGMTLFFRSALWHRGLAPSNHLKTALFIIWRSR